MNQTGNHNPAPRISRLAALALAVALGLSVLPAFAQEKPFVPSDPELAAWLKSSADSLRSSADPDKSLVGTQYLGLIRDGKPVGCEIFTTSVTTRSGKSLYSFDDRAVLVTPEGGTVRVSSTGLSDPSFTGLEASLKLLISGPKPLTQTMSARRTADTVEITLPGRDAAGPRTLRVRTAGLVVALSGEVQRLIRIRKWKPGDTLALWHLDLANGNLSPLVLRALDNKDPAVAGRPLGPLKVETWATQDAQHPGLALQSTTFFAPDGSVALIIKPDGITKLVLTKTEFEKDWAGKFPPAD
jgi:hypothetical protein